MPIQFDEEAQRVKIKALLEEALAIADMQNLQMVGIRISEALDALTAFGKWSPMLPNR
jgi:hypothetical protein